MLAAQGRKTRGFWHSSLWVRTFVVVVVSSLVACAPQTQPSESAPIPSDVLVLGGNAGKTATRINRVATAAWHRMELNYLNTGHYATSILNDLVNSLGNTTFRLENLTESDYRLSFTSPDVPNVIWYVTPVGVRVFQGELG